ncbi:MAG: restriction endonuclease [Limnothrix sp. RL_2_0]|nr:restriction endonuclease [Limnothrix sp. RL_2_0]
MTEIVLTEYHTKTFSKEIIPEAIALIIAQKYSSQITINFDWQTQKWQLSPKGWIGIIPITSDFSIRLQPKTQIKYIWQMLGWVENLQSLKIFDSLSDSEPLENICDRLARILAKKIFHRTKQGLYSTYLSDQAQLTAPRGQIQWHRAARQPWETRLPCRYSTQTADVRENQILLWTIHQLGRSPYLFQPETTDQLRHAHRALQHSISLTPFTAKDCHNFHYHRLNEDYEILHQLCHFFLANLSPSHQIGNAQTIPFLLNTAILYEKFVYAWLKQNLPEQYEIKAQEKYRFNEKTHFNIDLVLYDTYTKKAIAVLDTKYKTPEKPSPQDLSQIISYATFKHTQRAILIYPKPLKYSVEEIKSNIQIETLTFSLDKDLEQAGNDFLHTLFANILNLKE